MQESKEAPKEFRDRNGVLWSFDEINRRWVHVSEEGETGVE